MCPLCFSNDIGDKKHYIFHCTNPKLVEIRKTFTPKTYETFVQYPDVNSITQGGGGDSRGKVIVGSECWS